MSGRDDIDAEIRNRSVPKLHHGTYRRALAGRSRTAAIKAMCLECQGWEDGAIQAVRECPSAGCPLHAVRPYQVDDNDTDSLDEAWDPRKEEEG